MSDSNSTVESFGAMGPLPDIHLVGPGGCLPKPEFLITFFDLQGSLTVNPEIMYQKSVTVGEKITKMKTAFSDLETTVNKTNNYWLGEAADTHREYFNSAKPDIEEIFNRLSEHARELGEMAAVYANVEKEVTQISEDLPSDVIL